MLYLRQSATHKVVIGPVVAVGDGFTPITNLDVATADEAEVILHDNGTVVDISGYTWAAIATADGYYHLTLQAGISGTVGHMVVVINDDSLCLPVRADFMVIEEAVYDAMYAASAAGPNTTTPPTAAANADAVWDEAQADHVAAGSFGITASEIAAIPTTAMRGTDSASTAAALATHDGKLDTVDGIVDAIVTDTGTTLSGTLATIVGYLDTEIAAIVAAVITNAAGADIAADIIAMKAETVLIVADTNELQTDDIPGTLSTIGTDTARLTAVRAAVLTDLIDGGRLDLLIDAIKVITDALTAAAAAKMALSAGTMVTGTVSHDNTAASTTVFYCDDITEATADHYNGRIVAFTSGALVGQYTDITDYALDTGEGKFTVTALTEAPADNVTFIII